MTIITTKNDLHRWVEDHFDSHPPDDDTLERITDELWHEGHEKGLRSGQDWDSLLDAINLVDYVTDS